MKKFIRLLMLSVALVSTGGCFQPGFIYQEQVAGRCYLLAVEQRIQTNLSYKLDNGDFVGVVEETVFAVGFNDDFIIVKQHPDGDYKITNYYIVIIRGAQSDKDIKIQGPFPEADFMKMRQLLQVPRGLTFTKVVQDLE